MKPIFTPAARPKQGPREGIPRRFTGASDFRLKPLPLGGPDRNGQNAVQVASLPTEPLTRPGQLKAKPPAVDELAQARRAAVLESHPFGGMAPGGDEVMTDERRRYFGLPRKKTASPGPGKFFA